MKNIYTGLFIFISLSCSLFGWSKGSYLKPDFISNPYNDKEIILTGILSGNFTNNTNSFLLDIITGTCTNIHINFSGIGAVNDVIINGNSNRIGYVANGKINIYNYINSNLISSFVINYDNDKNNYKIGFSTDGEYVYTLKKSELLVSVYSTNTGIKIDEVLINTNPALYSGAYLNEEKAEFALLKNDSLEIWSILNENLLRTIPFKSGAKLVQFRNSGNNISYINGSNVYIINALTGDEIYSRSFPINISYLELSSNMKYLIGRDSEYKQFVWDVEADTSIFSISTPHYDGKIPYFNYINSEFSQAIGYEKTSRYCGVNGDMPTMENVYFLYDLPDINKVISVSDGYAGNPENAVFSTDNELILVSSGGNQDGKYYYINSLVNINGEFQKYIPIYKSPLAFTLDSKYIAFADSNKILFYNTATDKVEKELVTDRKSNRSVFFIPQKNGMVISVANEYIDVYDYNSLSLKYTKDLIGDGILNPLFKYDINGKITIFSSGKLYDFDAESGKFTPTELINLPANGNFSDMTNDGRFVLWTLGKDSVIVYDSKFQNIRFSYKAADITQYAENVKMGFLGNNENIWISYINNPMDKDKILYSFNFTDKNKTILNGTGNPVISNDGSYYTTFKCPETYTLNSIPAPVSVNESAYTENRFLIYPNPASDFITVQPSEVLKTSEDYLVQIYNIFGIEAGQSSLIDGNNRIDVSALPVGVYYIRIGDKVAKFVKM